MKTQQKRQKAKAAAQVPVPSEPGPQEVALAPVSFGRATIWVCLALIVLNVVIYTPVRHFGFINWDDPIYVTENPQVLGGLSWHNGWWALTTGHAPYWHPLTWLSHMLDVQLYGVNAGRHHLTNVLLHIANSILVFFLFFKLTGALGRSAFVAALFAAHPLHVESVVWVAERKDVLSTLFWLLTVWAYVWYVAQPKLRRYLIVVLAFVLALMSKPMVVTLPFVLLLLDVWPLGRVKFGQPRSVWLELIKEKIPLLVLAIASSVATFIIQRQVGAMANLGSIPLSRRLANALISYVAYIAKMLWPVRLSPFYPYPQSINPAWVAAAVLVLILLSAAVIRAGRKRPYVAVGWLWYVGTLFPVIGVFQAGEQAMADRFVYVPLIGLFVIIAWGVDELSAHWPYRRIALPAGAGLAILACIITARTYLPYWNDDLTVWKRALDVTTENYLAHNNLAAALLLRGKADEAIPHYSEAIRIKPAFAYSHYGMGAALDVKGRSTDAMPYYTEAVRLSPNMAEPHYNLGVDLAKQGKAQDAIVELSEALSAKPDWAEAHWYLGTVFEGQGRIGDAVEQYSEAVRIKPQFAEAHNSLGWVLANQGKSDEALPHYREALRISPKFADAHNNLGVALASQGKIDQAIAEFGEALRADPKLAKAHNNLGVALVNQGRRGEAVDHFREALRIDPNFEAARRALDALKAQ